MNTKRYVFTAAVLFAGLATGAARAATLDALFQGGSISTGDLVFENFELLSTPTFTNGGFVNTANIEVTPVTDDPGNPGIRYSVGFDNLGTPFDHPGDATAHLDFAFSVRTSNGSPLIGNKSLVLDDFAFDAGPDATLKIRETIISESAFQLGNSRVKATFADQPGSGAENLTDFVAFPPQSMLLVENFVEIHGPSQNDGVRLIAFEQRFTQVPEPGALVLAAFGAVAAVCRRRDRHGR